MLERPSLKTKLILLFVAGWFVGRFLVVGFDHNGEATPPPDPALEKASETELSGLAASVQYLRRERGSLVIGYRLSQRTLSWDFHGEEGDARVRMWDDAGREIGTPAVRTFWYSDAFLNGKQRSLRVRLTIPCPAKARWVTVQLYETKLETKKVAIPPASWRDCPIIRFFFLASSGPEADRPNAARPGGLEHVDGHYYRITEYAAG
jgi:hypothetical protein